MYSNQKIITADVYVQVAGCFLFQIGPTRAGETLGVVRLGSHREGNETEWECAAREAFEEPLFPANLFPHQPRTGAQINENCNQGHGTFKMRLHLS